MWVYAESMCSAHTGQKRVSNPLELDLKEVVSHWCGCREVILLEEQQASPLNCWDISLAYGRNVEDSVRKVQRALFLVPCTGIQNVPLDTQVVLESFFQQACIYNLRYCWLSLPWKHKHVWDGQDHSTDPMWPDLVSHCLWEPGRLTCHYKTFTEIGRVVWAELPALSPSIREVCGVLLNWDIPSVECLLPN